MKFAKTDSRYWKDRLYKTKEGLHALRITFKGERHRFELFTAKENEACKKASQIYTMLVTEGWEATLEHYKPYSVLKIAEPTFKDVFEAVRTVSTVKTATVEDYIRACRNIVTGIKGLDKDNSRYSKRSAGYQKWIDAVDNTKLTEVTPAKVRDWRDKFINSRAKGNPDSKVGHSAKVSSNSLLRQARSLFGGGCLSKLRDREITLPHPLPFHDENERQNRILSKIDGDRLKYKSTIDFLQVIEDAREELGTIPEKRNEWLIFLLCGLAGLRRNEADKLLWAQVDTRKKKITITNTEYFTAKNASSEDEVLIDDELSTLLQGYKARAKKDGEIFVLQSVNEIDLTRTDRSYRCEKDYERLIAWLRYKGIKERKAIHALRKEIASHLYGEQGIDSAKSFLRHSNTATTERFYADPSKRKTTSGLGHLLNKPSNIEELPTQRKA